jgi:hypothetical protein
VSDDLRNPTVKKPPRWRKAFLAALAECGVVSRACQAAKADRTSVYDLRRQDSLFAQEWDEALQTAADKLEEEARRRAHDGILKMKFHQGTAIIDPRTGQPYYELEYSDTLLIFLLKAARPEKYRERYEVNQQGTVRLEVVEELHDGRDDTAPPLPPAPGPAALPPE